MLLLAAFFACTSPDAGPHPTVRLGDVRTASPIEAVRGAWGADFGRDATAPVGPMAVLRDGDGFAVLDQEKLRLLRYDADGSPRGQLAIPTRSTLDAVARPDGSFGLLAYHRTPAPHWTAQTVGATGLVAEVGATVDLPTGIFADGAALLVESGHDLLTDVLTGRQLPGRPDGEGRYVQAVRHSALDLELRWSDAEGLDSRVVQLAPDRPVGEIVDLQPVPASVTGELPAAVLTLFMYEEDAALQLVEPELRVVVVDQLGHVADELRIAPGQGTTLHRQVAVGPDGSLFQLQTGPEGAAVGRAELSLAGRR